MTTDRPLRVSVAGLGYWGPNLARNFAALPGAELAWCCDASDAMRERYKSAFPTTSFAAEQTLAAWPDED